MRLPLDELTNYLDSSQSRLKSWAQQTAKSAADRKKEHLQALQDSEGNTGSDSGTTYALLKSEQSLTVVCSAAAIEELHAKSIACESQARELQRSAASAAALRMSKLFHALSLRPSCETGKI